MATYACRTRCQHPMATMLAGLEATGGRYGLQTMCEAGGMPNATVIERL
ncbi:hypothetical protein AB0M95_29615 [Sphaerisporangium sp. NPDC051017]